MHTINILSLDECQICCEKKWKLKQCPLENCDYKICKACKKKLSNNTCQACRRECIININQINSNDNDNNDNIVNGHDNTIYDVNTSITSIEQTIINNDNDIIYHVICSNLILLCIKVIIPIIVLIIGYIISSCMLYECDIKPRPQILMDSLIGSLMLMLFICVNALFINLLLIMYKTCLDVTCYNKDLSIISIHPESESVENNENN